LDHHAEIVGISLHRGQPACERFVHKLSRLTRDLGTAERNVPHLAATVRAIRRTESLLRRPLRLALIGESNSGKSTVTNLLLGMDVLPSFQVANTRVPTLIRHGRNPSVAAVMDGGKVLPLGPKTRTHDEIAYVRVELPFSGLQACEILDFPGLSDPLLGYKSANIFSHRIDAAIWCTFSTQAWKESESAAWRDFPARIQEHGLLAVTNKDRLKKDQLAKVMARLDKVAGSDFQAFAFLSSLDALKALNRDGHVQNDEVWRESGAADLHEKVGQLVLDLRLLRLRKAQAFIGRIAGYALNRFDAIDPALPG
jgi:predicted ABC-type transport system involved in lysophospholipase L1 biosynthesis ATPase subunit